MSIVRALRYFVTQYRSIEDSALRQTITLYEAKDALDALEKEYNTQNAQSPDRLVLADQTEPNQVRRWTTGDGTRIPVGNMTDSHLFYALAKAKRGEYPDTASRATGVCALELEAFRRLRNQLTGTAPPPKFEPEMKRRSKFSCGRCSGETAHQSTCPILSHI